MSARFFEIFTTDKWGDYWHTILCGISGGRRDGRLEFMRTGPMVPPLAVTLADDLVVTESITSTLRHVSGVTGFLPVIKEKIVRLDWSTWSLDGDEPALRRFEEPEDVVLAAQHDANLSHEIGELYEVLLETDGMITEDFDGEGNLTASFTQVPSRGYDLFKSQTPGGYGSVVGSDRFVASLPHEASRWLQFVQVTLP